MKETIRNKVLIALIISGAFLLFGFAICHSAHGMAWPQSYSYSGPASETSWGQMEVAYRNIGLILVGTGCLLAVITITRWLFMDALENKL